MMDPANIYESLICIRSYDGSGMEIRVMIPDLWGLNINCL